MKEWQGKREGIEKKDLERPRTKTSAAIDEKIRRLNQEYGDKIRQLEGGDHAPTLPLSVGTVDATSLSLFDRLSRKISGTQLSQDQWEKGLQEVRSHETRTSKLADRIPTTLKAFEMQADTYQNSLSAFWTRQLQKDMVLAARETSPRNSP